MIGTGNRAEGARKIVKTLDPPSKLEITVPNNGS